MKFKRIIALILAIVMLLTLIYTLCACGDNSDSDTCGICGGSGKVTYKFIGEGSPNSSGYYRCKGCHGSGKS